MTAPPQRKLRKDAKSDRLLETNPSLSMPKPTASAAKNLRYRQRLRAAGGEEVLFQLPRETVVMLKRSTPTHVSSSRWLRLAKPP